MDDAEKRGQLIKLTGETWWEVWERRATIAEAILRNNGTQLAMSFTYEGTRYDVVLDRSGSKFVGTIQARFGREYWEGLASARTYFSGNDILMLGEWHDKDGQYPWLVQLFAEEDE